MGLSETCPTRVKVRFFRLFLSAVSRFVCPSNLGNLNVCPRGRVCDTVSASEKSKNRDGGSVAYRSRVRVGPRVIPCWNSAKPFGLSVVLLADTTGDERKGCCCDPSAQLPSPSFVHDGLWYTDVAPYFITVLSRFYRQTSFSFPFARRLSSVCTVQSRRARLYSQSKPPFPQRQSFRSTKSERTYESSWSADRTLLSRRYPVRINARLKRERGRELIPPAIRTPSMLLVVYTKLANTAERRSFAETTPPGKDGDRSQFHPGDASAYTYLHEIARSIWYRRRKIAVGDRGVGPQNDKRSKLFRVQQNGSSSMDLHGNPWKLKNDCSLGGLLGCYFGLSKILVRALSGTGGIP